jgi:hemin uptake protein HemP
MSGLKEGWQTCQPFFRLSRDRRSALENRSRSRAVRHPTFTPTSLTLSLSFKYGARVATAASFLIRLLLVSSPIHDLPEKEQPPLEGVSGTSEPVITSESLFGTHRQVLIRHSDEMYRLRITKSGKLILTK